MHMCIINIFYLINLRKVFIMSCDIPVIHYISSPFIFTVVS